MKTVLRVAAGLGFCLGVFPAHGLSAGSSPRVPFSGIYGGTAGAGAITVWDRSGSGDNPAAIGPPGWTFSAAGYAPFGLEGVRVTEAVVTWDRTRWGVSGSYQGMFSTGGDGEEGGRVQSTGVGLQSALRLGGGLTLGVAGEYRAESGAEGADGAVGTLGMLWRPRPWGSVGAFLNQEWNRETSPWSEAMRAGVGAEGGFDFAGVGWRLCLDAIYTVERDASGWEYRFGTGLRLHRLLSVYAGWDRTREAAALGVRFGIGDWEGFSSMRRHRLLGGTSVQGIRWYHADKNAGKSVTEYK